MDEETKHLRTLLQQAHEELERLKSAPSTPKLADEAASCAVFLASSVGRTFIERLGRLSSLEAAVRKVVGDDGKASLPVLEERLLSGKWEA